MPPSMAVVLVGSVPKRLPMQQIVAANACPLPKNASASHPCKAAAPANVMPTIGRDTLRAVVWGATLPATPSGRQDGRSGSVGSQTTADAANRRGERMTAAEVRHGPPGPHRRALPGHRYRYAAPTLHIHHIPKRSARPCASPCAPQDAPPRRGLPASPCQGGPCRVLPGTARRPGGTSPACRRFTPRA